MTDEVDGLAIERDGGVLQLRIERGEAGNAITYAMRNRMIAELSDASADPDVRCVLISSVGRHFCTGADLRFGQPKRPSVEGRPDSVTGDIRRTILTGAQALVGAVLDCEKPVVAKVHGPAAGLGAHLAFACDITVVGESATFTEIFARRGLVDDALGTWLLPRLVGLTRARELVLLAETVPAQRAHEIGLVTRLVPDADLDGATKEIVAKLAAGPTTALALDKFLLNRSLDSDRAALAQEEALAVELNSHTHDAAEGVASFVERRETTFDGW